MLPDGERIALQGPMRLGRGAGNDVRLTDPSVSREHARVVVVPDGLALEDADSSHGTLIDGRLIAGRTTLHEDMRIGLGDCELRVEERGDQAAAGRTMSVPPGVSVVVSAVGGTRAESRTQASGAHPRLRSGWSLKRLEAAEGPDRFVLKALRAGEFLRLGAPEAELLELLDGRHRVSELVAEAERIYGPDGAARLARLLADLADRDMLSEVAGARDAGIPLTLLARILRPRAHLVKRAGGLFAVVYRRGGFLLFTRPIVALLSLVGIAGLTVFGVLVAKRYGTPFLVGRRVGLGALIFVGGRFVLVAFHELAHGLICESFGRPITRAGLKTVLVFPYAFVDTSDAWFEPRRRRMAVSLAGPASDLVIGGACALACAAAPPGSTRDVLFQLALAGYVGALFNLNPLLDRDGYHVLADLLRQPALRNRARQEVGHLLGGRRTPDAETRILVRYGLASLGWSVLTVTFAIVMSLRYYDRLAGLAPRALVWTLLASFYLVLVLPVGFQIGRPLWDRSRTPDPNA